MPSAFESYISHSCAQFGYHGQCVQKLVFVVGGLALLMELFSHGDREQAELALQLLGDLLNPDLTSTEQVQSMQQMLSQQRVTEALALAMHPMCEDGEEAEATIGTTLLIFDHGYMDS